jgi:hypothetical protein
MLHVLTTYVTLDKKTPAVPRFEELLPLQRLPYYVAQGYHAADWLKPQSFRLFKDDETGLPFILEESTEGDEIVELLLPSHQALAFMALQNATTSLHEKCSTTRSTPADLYVLYSMIKLLKDTLIWIRGSQGSMQANSTFPPLSFWWCLTVCNRPFTLAGLMNADQDALTDPSLSVIVDPIEHIVKGWTSETTYEMANSKVFQVPFGERRCV